MAWPAIDELAAVGLLCTVEPMDDGTAEIFEVDVVLYSCGAGMDIDVGSGNSELIGRSIMDVENAGSSSSVSAADGEASPTVEDDEISPLVNCTAVVKLADDDNTCSEDIEAGVSVSEG